MTKKRIDLKMLISETFEIDIGKINIDSSAENIDKWDSLSHVRLIVKLEEYLPVKLDAKTASRIITVRKILKLLNDYNIFPKSNEFLEVFKDL